MDIITFLIIQLCTELLSVPEEEGNASSPPVREPLGQYNNSIPPSSMPAQSTGNIQPSSDVHKGRSCTCCLLCKEIYMQYTHPIKWKNTELLAFLQAIEPELSVTPDACICRNCRNSLSSGLRNPEGYKPRWLRVGTARGTMECEVPGCATPAYRCTRLASKEDISRHLHCAVLGTTGNNTNLCDEHYRALHRHTRPESYQRRCAVCLTAIGGANLSQI